MKILSLKNPEHPVKKKKQEKKRKHTILVQNTIENDKGEISIQNRYQIGEFT
jgi:type IV secretory pathway component VirB8